MANLQIRAKVCCKKLTSGTIRCEAEPRSEGKALLSSEGESKIRSEGKPLVCSEGEPSAHSEGTLARSVKAIGADTNSA